MPRVLIAEDEADTARALAEFLEGRGHEVRVAHHSDDALALGRTFAPEVLLCSLLLEGGKGGVEVARRLCAVHPELHVLFISGLPAEALDQDLAGIPVREILVKPVGLEQITRAVETATRDGRTR